MQTLKGISCTLCSGQGQLTVHPSKTISQFLSFIVVCHHQDHGGKEKTLEKTQEETTHSQTGKVLNETISKAHQTPCQGHARNDAVVLQTLSQQGRGNFGDDIEYVEDGYGNLLVWSTSLSYDRERVAIAGAYDAYIQLVSF